MIVDAPVLVGGFIDSKQTGINNEEINNG